MDKVKIKIEIMIRDFVVYMILLGTIAAFGFIGNTYYYFGVILICKYN